MRRKNVNYKPSKQQAGLGLAVGIVFIILGVGMVIPMSFAGGPFFALFGLAWTGIAVYNVVINARYLKNEKTGESENLFGGYEVTEEPDASFRPEAADHEHITVGGLDAKARLEQLETLKGAGLLTPEEYAEKRKDILNDL